MMSIKNFFFKCRKHIAWLKISLDGYLKFRKIIDKDSCVLFSHNGDSAGGAPVVLFELACSIKNTEKVVFLCGKPGGIVDLCEKKHIQVFSTYLLQNAFIHTMEKKKIKALIINTVALSKVVATLNNYDCSFPVFWWIHEEKKLLLSYKPFMPKKLKSNIHVLCVSSTVQQNLNEMVPEYCGRSNVFYYGCRDIYSSSNSYLYSSRVKDSTFVVSVIGRLCERKNQIQVVEAYNLLPARIREKVIIRFIYASAEKTYLSRLKDISTGNSNIKFVGTVLRSEMDKIYYTSDLIVCSSIDDPLPVVITEAMMFRIPFITSSKTGQYSLVKDGINGYKYSVTSTEELMKAIVRAYDNKSLEDMKKKERELYLKYFTPCTVRNNFEALFSSACKTTEEEV